MTVTRTREGTAVRNEPESVSDTNRRPPPPSHPQRPAWKPVISCWGLVREPAPPGLGGRGAQDASWCAAAQERGPGRRRTGGSVNAPGLPSCPAVATAAPGPHQVTHHQSHGGRRDDRGVPAHRQDHRIPITDSCSRRSSDKVAARERWLPIQAPRRNCSSHPSSESTVSRWLRGTIR